MIMLLMKRANPAYIADEVPLHPGTSNSAPVQTASTIETLLS